MPPNEVNTELAEFLFDIVKQVKQFYETPVVFYTKKDYSDTIFNTMCSLRSAFLEDADDKNEKLDTFKKNVMDHVVDYHLQWLQSVNEIDKFKQRVEDNRIKREEIFEAVTFTLDAMNQRLKYFIRYVNTHKVRLNNHDQIHINDDIEIMEDMHSDIVAAIEQKMKCYMGFDCDDTFKQNVILGIDELFLYNDKLYDSLSINLSKYINLNLPQLTNNLTKTLQKIVDELQSSDAEDSQKVLNALKENGKEISTMIRSTVSRNLEISKIVEKINLLSDRIYRMEHEETSAAVLALKNKKELLEMRLQSLEKMKTTIKDLHESCDLFYDSMPDDELCECQDFYQLRIFNHLLPVHDREHLVTELCYLWDLAVFGEKARKSLISILSARDNKEEFTDDLGTFYIDEYNRKIYKIPGDDTLYQTNEVNELVPLDDDSENVYFYDECGRYYIDRLKREKIYKAHANASEYVMDTDGVLLKIKEDRDGKTFYYDNFGRYYVNENGKHIYQDEEGGSEYEHDGLGNLVRIRSLADFFELCPDDIQVSEDFNYLKYAVGAALKRCIADVILHQPDDPVKYLGQCLLKYRENMQLKDKLAIEREELEIIRERICAEERAAAEKAALEATLLQGGSEASYDTNLANYGAVNYDYSSTKASTSNIN